MRGHLDVTAVFRRRRIFHRVQLVGHRDRVDCQLILRLEKLFFFKGKVRRFRLLSRLIRLSLVRYIYLIEIG